MVWMQNDWKPGLKKDSRRNACARNTEAAREP